jgi:hypothetical protein
MADLEQDVFESGASPDVPADLAPSPDTSVSPQPQEARAVSDAISSLRGPVPQYGVQPAAPRPQPPNPDDEPVKSGVLRDLLEERTQRQKLESHVRELQRREQERAAQQAQPKAEDMLFTDPDKFIAQIESKHEKKLADIQLNFDMQLASMRHGPAFDAAWQHFFATCQGGQDPVSYFRVMNARSPGEEMVRWFNERRLMHETGGNLDAYRQRILEEALQNPEFMARLQAQGGVVPSQQPSQEQRARGDDGRFLATAPQPQPRHEVRLPTSLSRMNGSRGMPAASEVEDGSEEAIFDAGRSRPRN